MKKTIALFVLIFASALHAKDVTVKDFGAIGDGTALDSPAIQRAIDEATSAGGGKVIVPAGKYLAGTIVLKDNVTLHLEDGAEILGTTDLAQYKNLDPFKEGLGAEVGTAFLVAIDAKNVAIEGKGTLNGNGKAVADAKGFKGEGWGFRPMLLRIVRCENVALREVTFRDSAAWTTNYFQSKNVRVENVTIDSHVAPHNDGINIDSCEDFAIANCDVDSGDDAIVLKSTSLKPCRNITATGCKLKSRQGAIKLGTESVGGFENIRVSNCAIRDTSNGGIKVLCVDGGTLQDVIISDITMTNVKTPIFVRLGARMKVFREGEGKKEPGVIRNVTIKNVKATADPKSQLMPPTGVFITGIPDHRIERLTLENIDIHLPGGGTSADAQAVVDQKPDTYPEINRFGKTLPAYGVFARHVKDLTLKNVTLTLDSPDLRPALVAQDVQGLNANGWHVPVSPDAECVVRLESSKDTTIKDVTVDGNAKQLVLTANEK
jgi:polygalacturonase